MMNFVALCAIGAEKILSHEIKKLASLTNIAYTIIESSYGKVRFKTDIKGIYHILAGLRTADRVLLQCAKGPARDFDELFELARGAPLENYIPRNMPLVMEKIRSNRSALSALSSIQSVAHKGIVSRLCAKYGLNRLPSAEDAKDAAALRVYIEKDNAEILLDLCGEPLYKRGYSRERGLAPLRETVAAGVILSLGWKRKYPLYDPFCGSGTIAIEAALYACDIAPGIARRFALEKFNIADSAEASKTRDFFLQKADLSRLVRIAGSDSTKTLVEAARRNLRRAFDSAAGPDGPEIPVKFSCVEAANAKSAEKDGFIITNPPYGLRIGGTGEAEENYRNMAVLKKNFPDWKIAVISDNAGFESFFGFKARNCREVVCGAVKQYVFFFD